MANLLVDWLNKNKKTKGNVGLKGSVGQNGVNVTSVATNPTNQSSTNMTGNVTAPVNNVNAAPITPVNTGSRFVGFQRPELKQVQAPAQQGLSFGKLTSGQYNIVKTPVREAEINNAKEETRYRTMSEALMDLQGDLYKNQKEFNDAQLKYYYPEFKDNLAAVKELQKELLPIVKSGMGVDAAQLEQFYPELLKPKDIKDIEQVRKESEENNKRFDYLRKQTDKALRGNADALSVDGLKYLKGVDTMLKSLDQYKKQGNIGSSDYDILNDAIKNNPELQKLQEQMNSYNLSEKDKQILGKQYKTTFGTLMNQVWNAADSVFDFSHDKYNQQDIDNMINVKENLTGSEYWNSVKTNANAPINNIKKFMYGVREDFIGDMAKVGKQQMATVGPDGKLQYADNDFNKAMDQIKADTVQNKREYNDKVNAAFQKSIEKNLNPEVKAYYDSKSITELLAKGDMKGANYKMLEATAQNWQTIPEMIITAINPYIGLGIMSADAYAQSNQGIYEELTEMGVSEEEARTVAQIGGTAEAAVEVMLEKVLGGVEYGAASAYRRTFMRNVERELVEKASKGVFKDVILKAGKEQLKESTTEGLEEVVQTVIENAAKKTFNDDQALLEGVGEAFEGGFYNPMNAIGGGMSLVENAQVNKDQIEQQLSKGAYNAGAAVGTLYNGTKNMLGNTRSLLQGKVANRGQQVQEQQQPAQQQEQPENTSWSTPQQSTLGKVVGGVMNAGNKVYDKVVDPVTDKVAEGITSTTTPQDKLFKAINPSLNVLTNKNTDYKSKRQSADRTNELIIEYGRTPETAAEAYTALIQTKQDVWNNGIQQGLEEHKYDTVDSKSITNAVRDELKLDSKITLQSNKSDLALLQKELSALDNMQELHLEEIEELKQQINAKLHRAKNPQAGEFYESGLRALNRQLSKIEDEIISKLPGQFSKFKRDYGVLKNMEEDFLKMMLKDMKKKDNGIVENRGRLEGLTKIGGKNTLEGILQFFLGESLGKAKNTNFLIKSGYAGLREKYGNSGTPAGLDIKKNPPAPALEDKRTDVEKGKIAEIDRRTTRNKEEGYNKPKNAITGEKTAVTEKKTEKPAETKPTEKKVEEKKKQEPKTKSNVEKFKEKTEKMFKGIDGYSATEIENLVKGDINEMLEDLIVTENKSANVEENTTEDNNLKHGDKSEKGTIENRIDIAKSIGALGSNLKLDRIEHGGEGLSKSYSYSGEVGGYNVIIRGDYNSDTYNLEVGKGGKIVHSSTIEILSKPDTRYSYSELTLDQLKDKLTRSLNGEIIEGLKTYNGKNVHTDDEGTFIYDGENKNYISKKPKNTVTSQKTAVTEKPTNHVMRSENESEIQKLADKNGTLSFDGDYYVYEYDKGSVLVRGVPIVDGSTSKYMNLADGYALLKELVNRSLNKNNSFAGIPYDDFGKFYIRTVEGVKRIVFENQKGESVLDYELKAFLKRYQNELQGIDKPKQKNIIGQNNSLTTNNSTNESKLGTNEQRVGGSIGRERGAVKPKISDVQSVESRSTIQEQPYSNGERYANSSLQPASESGTGPTTGGEPLSRAEQRKVNDQARDIVEKHGYSQNRADYTPEELSILFQFEGNGGLANADDKDIKGSRFEFYTPESPTKALQRGIEKYSDRPITKIFDPTGGKGNLFVGISDTIEKVMYEINKVSGTIAKLRFPEANVRLGEDKGDYQKRFLDFMGKPIKTPTDGSVNASAIIGNPPFGERIKVRDDKDIKRLEEYFVKRPIEVDLEDGGIAGYVMPSTWLRGRETAGKKWLGENTQIVDAYRLPAGVFSYTDVGTDLIIIKKQKPTAKTDDFFNNNYFTKHPEKVLGEEKTRVRGFGEEIYVEGDPKAIEKLWINKDLEQTPTQTVPVESTKNKITSTEKNTVTAPKQTATQEQKATFTPDKKEAPKSKTAVTDKKPTEAKKGKKQPKLTVIKGTKTDTGTYTFGDQEQLKIMEAVDPDGFVKISEIGVSKEDVKAGAKGLNYIDGKVQPDFLYFSGDIYDKLDKLEADKDQLSPEQYKKQKDGLKAVMPERRKLLDIQFSVLDEQLMATETSQLVNKPGFDEETGRWNSNRTIKGTISDLFQKFMEDSYRQSGSGIFSGTGTNPRTIVDFYTGKKNMDKDKKAAAKERADIIFNDFIKNGLDDVEKEALEDKYNRDYVAVVRPNYDAMPIKVDNMSATFYRRPLNLSPIQWLGVKAMVSKGSMSIAHGVGYGKTLEGITATEILLQRGRVEKPVFIVPKGTKKSWISTYTEAFPNREIVDLGGLLVDDIKRLTSEFGPDPRNWIKPGQVAIITHSGFERNVSFKKEWLEELTAGLRDVMETKDESGKSKKKSARKQEEQQDKLEAIAEGTAETKGGNSKAMIALAKYNPDALKEISNEFEGLTYEDFLQTFKDKFTADGSEYKVNYDNDIIEADAKAMWSMRPVYVEDLGLDHIVVDEVHNYKNIFRSAETEKDDNGNRVKDNRFGNVQGSSSARGRKMYSLSQYVLKKNGGRGVFTLSATPFNNQALEVYNILSLHAYNRLLEMGIRNINDFFGKFADFREDLVAKANGTFEFKDVMVSFKNVRELQRLLLEYMDYRADNPDLVRPENVVKKVELDMSDLQQDVQDGIEAQLNDEKALKNEPGLMLKLIGQMRLNLISPYLTENYKDLTPTRQELIESSPKLKFTLDTIKRLRDEGHQDGVFIFMPYMGENGKLHNVLKEAIENYVGADRVNVGIINGKTTGSVKDADGDSIDKKTATAEEFRRGKLNVLIGGENTVEGINLQDEGYITIDLLLGWNPTQTIQLFGRVWRQGNFRNHAIQLLPLMRNSGDIVMLQKFLEKSSRINDLLSFQGLLFNVEDLDSNEERLALLTDIEKKADLQLLLDEKKYQKEDQKIASQEDGIKKVLEKVVTDEALQTQQQRVDDRVKEVEQFNEAIKNIPEENPAYRSIKSDLDNAKYRLETERKDLRKMKSAMEYVANKLELYNVQTVDQLKLKLEELGRKRTDIANLIKGLKDSRPAVVQQLRDQRAEEMKNQKSYDEYLDDMSYLFKQKVKFSNNAELKQRLNNNTIDKPSDKRNVLGNDMNKITSGM